MFDFPAVEKTLNKTFPTAKSKHDWEIVFNTFDQPKPEWSFEDVRQSETLWGPHGYHRYPAKFIPQLVRRIIDDYSEPGNLVGDSFVGSATTGIEALRANRHFWGLDVNPVALLISKAKCIPLEPKVLQETWKQFESHLAQVPHVGRRKLTEPEIKTIKEIKIAQASSDERLHYWFPDDYYQAIDSLLDLILTTGQSQIQTYFLCAFSNILRRCSIWLSGSTKPQKDLKKYLNDPAESFYKQVTNMMKRNALYWNDLLNSGVAPEKAVDRCYLTPYVPE